ncbi:MAG: tetratricopeptide repeat protein, partial [Hyphomicrobiales bacterium]|nr:tetratricopeptide repeat protein [Hyphomicrobiales bacterium]
ILDEVYVYGSFLQSKMYAEGVRCSDCHDVHAANLRAEGNAICTQCHSPAGNSRFPTVRKADYDDPSHHFHAAGSQGVECKSCHMIERVYMGIDGRRDHSFRVPRPDLTVNIGTPNACNDCHTDKSAEWAAAEIAERFPDNKSRSPHFGETFHRAWAGEATAKDLLTIAEDGTLPAIVRASALDLLGSPRQGGIIARAAEQLSDRSPLVRAAAITTQRHAALSERVRQLAPLLADTARSVRIAAAGELLSVPLAKLPDDTQQALRQAISERYAWLLAKSDFPEAQLILGGAALTLRDFDAAEAAFREAVRLDPQLVAAWAMIVRLRAARGDRTGAIEALDQALLRNPDSDELRGLQRQLR